MGAVGKILVGAVAIGGAILIADAISTKAAGDALKTDIDNVIFKGIKGKTLLDKKAVFDIVFKHTNPTNKNLNFDYVFLDVFVGSYPVAKIREQNLGYTIQKNSVTTMPLTASVSLLMLGFDVIQLLITKKLPDKVLITGNIRVNQYSVPFNSLYPLKLK